MSTDVVIRVENLTKKYVINHAKGRRSGDGLRHAIQDTVVSPFRRFGSRFRRSGHLVAPKSKNLNEPASDTEDFYALRDISFDVKRGEVIGIIGRNGAGKSTLLKVLSRITQPSSGRIGIKGRVASLLEVGTGFHPELTGRENIFLNGAILGMSRAEVRQQFDEIVDFSGVEKFLDTPVKRYSSGMYVRLAFSVAAHLEPEILIVDEVLAVGDAEFQQKCLGKIHDVVEKVGRTVLLVSHNLRSVQEICTSAILLDAGRLIRSGDVGLCSGDYLKQVNQIGSDWTRDKAPTRTACFRTASANLGGRQPALTLTVSGTLESSIDAQVMLACDISDESGVVVMQLLPSTVAELQLRPGGRDFSLVAKLPRLIPGKYLLSLWLGPHNYETYDIVRDAVSFVVSASPTDVPTYHHVKKHGYVVPECRFVYSPETSTSEE